MSGFMWSSASVFMGNMLSVIQFDQELDDRWHARFGWMYQFRHVRVNRERYGFTSGWSRSRGLSGDSTVPLYIFGGDASDGGIFEPIGVPDSGSSRGYFIVGVIQDGSGSPLAGAVLDLFLSSTNQWVSSVTSDSNGIYSLPTPYTGQNHYIYANYGPDTLVGASVDTLTPGLSPW